MPRSKATPALKLIDVSGSVLDGIETKSIKVFNPQLADSKKKS